MVVIPGWLIALITFPGIILHEFSHKLFCNWTNTPVVEVCYLNFKRIKTNTSDNYAPMGYVIHEQPKTLIASFLITIGPLIVNSTMAVLCGVIVALYSMIYRNYLVLFGLTWVGLSLGVHSFPSEVDAQSYYSQVKNKKVNIILHFIALLFVWIIQLANWCRFLWFDVIYAIILMSFPGVIIYGFVNSEPMPKGVWTVLWITLLILLIVAIYFFGRFLAYSINNNYERIFDSIRKPEIIICGRCHEKIKVYDRNKSIKCKTCDFKFKLK